MGKSESDLEMQLVGIVGDCDIAGCDCVLLDVKKIIALVRAFDKE